ncbi:hypothetical protein EDD18DRAFT_758917 [Armillaria luteobubalina]|uniref:Uncharacterized protein n=1 Tax=Armillaria luteobubalina TaxID=153913 RepID=A0AA39TE47_9AGAR|nr:hypothetical protein EDD18DRAFT_758917 [Armillaria luteobubalina]
MFGTTSWIVCLTALSGAAALPFSEIVRSLPRDIAHIAVDEARGHYLAFKRDGSLYGRYPVDSQSNNVDRRAASQCAQLSVDEAKTISGWDAIEQYANDNWGDGSRNIVTNPEDYVDSPAQVCITDDVVQLSFSGDPICQTHTTSSEGTLVGTTGEVDIEVDQGFNTDTSYTVSSASTIGVSNTLSVKVGIPEVADVTEAFTISTEVTDTTSSTFDVSYSDMSKVTVKMTAPEGKTCTATTSTKTCNIQATGKIRYLATGWIWFNYDDKTEGHYKWAVNIDSVVTNQDDRSSFATFKGSMASNTETSYAGNCA